MPREIISDQAPKALGPYSQAISIPCQGGEWVLVSGQIPLDTHTNQLVTHDFAKAVNTVLDNIAAILAAARLDWQHVVKSEIFLTDMKNFPILNAEYAKRFTSPPFPARQTVQVAALPIGADVEISCWAYRSSK